MSAVADLDHHIKNDLNSSQLSRIICALTVMMHKPVLGNNFHVLFAKMMFGLTDVVAAMETPQDAEKLLEAWFKTCVDKERWKWATLDPRGQRRSSTVHDSFDSLIWSHPLDIRVANSFLLLCYLSS